MSKEDYMQRSNSHRHCLSVCKSVIDKALQGTTDHQDRSDSALSLTPHVPTPTQLANVMPLRRLIAWLPGHCALPPQTPS